MKVLLFANIGNKDLGIENKAIFNNIKFCNNIYEETRNIYEKIKESYKKDSSNKLDKQFDISKLEPIILKPVIQYIKSKEYEIDKITLFGTEQIKTHPQDTYYIALIVKEILKNIFSLDENIIKVIKIDSDPSDRDLMYKYYETFFEKNFNNNEKMVFISLTGGTPAQNEAMLVTSVAKFKSNIQALYLPSNSKNVKLLNIAEIIYKKTLKEYVKLLTDKYIYDSAIELIENFGLEDEKNDLDLLKAKKYRILFNFKNALRYYNKALQKYSGEKKLEIKKEIEKLEKLENFEKLKELNSEYFSTYLLLLEELYENMKIKWIQGDYIDFIGRLFRFEEALLRLIFEKETSILLEKSNAEKFGEWVESNKNLADFLKSKKIIYTEPNRKVLRLILEFWVTKEEKKKLGSVLGFVKYINTPEGQSLADLRNKSILGHGFKGVSREDIKRYERNNLLKEIEKLIKFVSKIIFNDL